MRRVPAVICFALTILVALTPGLCLASVASAGVSSQALRYRVVDRGSGYVVVKGHDRTLVVRDRSLFTRARDGQRYRVVRRESAYVVLRRVASRYGCAKPVTTRTVRGLYIRGGTHDVTYSHVRFEGYSGSSPNGWTCVAINLNGKAGSIHDITFEHCVFATLPAGIRGNGFHMWNGSRTGKTISNITFKNCWFEPQPRMQIELNGRGGWWHDVTIDHCTFEPSGSQMLSFDMSPGDYTPTAPYGVTVGGVVRGVEGLRITNNDLRGTGAVVRGFRQTQWQLGLEFACVYPHGRTGKSEFSGNRVGRCASAWLNFSHAGARGMTFADNRFDWYYNPGGVAGSPRDWVWSGRTLSDCTFINNTYVLPNGRDTPWELMGIHAGHNDAFAWERWKKASGTMGGGFNLDFTDSTYTDCRFQVSAPVRFPASASGTGCVFESGHIGGRFD